METNTEQERSRFVADYDSGLWSMTELCERYGVSRPTGYKWIDRYEIEGEEGLTDRSRAPNHCPHRTPANIEARILELREKYGWGAKKLLGVLSKRYPRTSWPARSTINAILDRHGQLRKNRRRKRWKHPGAVKLETSRPNEIWPADFKGQFKTGDGQYCYPLTVTDHYSRKLLMCRGLPTTRTEHTKPMFLRLFREVGLPDAIRTDNGTPFASTGIHGLCELNVWWLQLGIVHQRIPPSSPQENAQHERMHRELKRETARPAAATHRSQQRRFDEFQKRYNEVRPHEGIDDEVPDSLWERPRRRYPKRIAGPEYPNDVEVRKVSRAGTFKLMNRQPFLSQALREEYIGLEETDDGVWDIVYYDTLLGRIDERTGVITGA